jgi:anti-sigma factor RsiW
MNCFELETLLCDYVDGTLAPGQRAEAERHLAQCPGCAEMAHAPPPSRPGGSRRQDRAAARTGDLILYELAGSGEGFAETPRLLAALGT